MAPPLLTAALKFGRRFGLTLKFWLALTASVVVACALALTAAVGHLLSWPFALSLLLIAATSARLKFRSWPGIHSPPTPFDRPAAEAPPGSVRVVCVSDTHGKIERERVPDGDVLIHAGDFTQLGSRAEVAAFNEWLGSLPHKHKVVVPGNHDLICDGQTCEANVRRLRAQQTFHGMAVEEFYGAEAGAGGAAERLSEGAMRALLGNARVLVGEACEVEVDVDAHGGATRRRISIFGFPYTDPIPTSAMAAFARDDDERRRLLRQFDRRVDILVTHGPPHGVLDRIFNGMRVGCKVLTQRLVELAREDKSPTFHVFGHIHEGRGVKYGAVLHSRAEDGTHAKVASKTTYVNASSVNLKYDLRPGLSKAMVFDIPR
ncbi:hypothetical protein AB1Y20_014061 [Prymnesium parvum]|uniref:Calcineurin-like phosphoesterase domain-containing protein n=1 Tax=Prymnesium parvum TaxID=97485 RepID=A0AB34IHB4_PRYPA